jgi:hypothetical protein
MLLHSSACSHDMRPCDESRFRSATEGTGLLTHARLLNSDWESLGSEIRAVDGTLAKEEHLGPRVPGDVLKLELRRRGKRDARGPGTLRRSK